MSSWFGPLFHRVQQAGWLGLVLFTHWTAPGTGVLADPEVDRLNTRVGTQTFSPRYTFTTNTALVETAEAIQAMGSDIIKLYLGRGMSGQYGISLPGAINSLSLLARNEPSVRRVLDMPFKHILAWTYCFSATGDSWWKDGYSATESQKEYDEIFALTACLLTNYNDSGKSFYLGHWEGDWYLLNNYVTTNNPSATAIAGMIDWLNNRQKAVDDAMASVPHTNVAVYHYTEANRVRDAMLNGSESNVRLVNAVLPYVTNIDFVSWSAYDGMHLGEPELHATLNYLENQLPAAKASVLSGSRVIIGEYGWGGSLSSQDQEPITRGFMQKLLPWSPRFILFWQMYNNEPNRAYWLIDTNNVRTPCFYLHQRLINLSRLSAARFREETGRLPSEAELAWLLKPSLAAPLPSPDPFTINHRPLADLSDDSATVQAAMQQNIYGDAHAHVGVCWGTTDGGTNFAAWEFTTVSGTNTRFGESAFKARLEALIPQTNYYYRFFASNENHQGWAPAAGAFRTEVLNPQDYGGRARIRFSGYHRPESLVGFPALVLLGTNIPGFSYRQFAFGDGRDLRFTDDVGQQIPHEIEEWNTNATSYVWVRVPLLEGPTNGVWACWGNPLNSMPASQTNGAVWNPGHKLVWHMREISLPFRDSALHHNAVAGDVPTLLAAGLIGRSSLFNGSSDFLTPAVVNVGELFTLSGWIKVDPAASSIQTLWANKTGGSSSSGFALFVHSYNSTDGKLILETGNGSSSAYASTEPNTIIPGRWQHVAAVVNRSWGEARLYVDGLERSIESAARPDFNIQATTFMGRFSPPATYYFRGAMDELRIDSESRSGNWVWAAWMNAASNDVFQAWSDVSRYVPELSCAARADALAFSWPAPGIGFRLLAATNLLAANWELVTNVPSLTGSHWEVAVRPQGNVPRFFRLNLLD